MNFGTLDSPVAKKNHQKIMNAEIQRKDQVAEEMQEKSAPDVDWKADRHHYLRFLRHQRRTRESHWHDRLAGH